MEGKVKEREEERRWREGFGPPKNFGVAPPMQESYNIDMVHSTVKFANRLFIQKFI